GRVSRASLILALGACGGGGHGKGGTGGADASASGVAGGSAGAVSGPGGGGGGGISGTSNAGAGAGVPDASTPDASESDGARDTSGPRTNEIVKTTFVNYEVNGMWPYLVAGTAAEPIKQNTGALTYRMLQVQSDFLAESCSIADYNHDGIPDLSSGRRWYEGPDFTKVHIYRGGHDALPRAGAANELTDGASDDQADYPFDVDGDGWPDIIDIANAQGDTKVSLQPMPQPHSTGYWYQNPGSPANAADTNWTPHLISADLNMKTHGLVDVDRDGKPEILGACRDCVPTQTKGYYRADPTDPTAAWKYEAVTPKDLYPFPFGGILGIGILNGIGMGDVNGDGRPDLLERGGVWLQQADGSFPGGATTSSIASCMAAPASCGWVQASFFAGDADGLNNEGGSQMFAYDVDGDGLTDIISGDNVVEYGLSWYQQRPSCVGATAVDPGGATDGGASSSCFVKHQIIGSELSADLAMYGVGFSEIHAVQLVDMDGDGLADIVTGKDWRSAPLDQGYADPYGAPVLYVFKLVRDANPASAGKAHFEPHLVSPAMPMKMMTDGGSGTGAQVAIGQINPQTDGIMDICIASKLGLFVYFGQ
ncbi:MAG TPA: VCBS repeat-containing protein, partial [Polyangia bacterium]|nr:VCBS repeat-containing protein [Polyangia bacterium]